MPPAYTEWKILSDQVKQFNETVVKHSNFLKLCSGQPTIYANSNKRLDLNANLNVIELNKKIDSKEPILSFVSTDTVEVTKVNQVVSMRAIPGAVCDHTKIVNGIYELYIDTTETDPLNMVKFKNTLTGDEYIVQMVKQGNSSINEGNSINQGDSIQ